MSDRFAEIVELCKRHRTTRKDVPEEHLRERVCFIGDGAERVYCLLALIEDARGFRWFAYLMATATGEIEGELLPLAEWTVARQLNACAFRGKFSELEPRMIETTDAEGYIFRGPYAAQNSEPNPPGVVPCGFVSLPSDHG